ncbi:MAG: galactokinase, partial [Solirubrobacteraceae bacterium]
MVDPAVTAFAPGRVNLIGEHTDYNGGLALPFAIEQGVTVRAVPTGGDRIDVHATDLDAYDSFPASAPQPVRGWRAFARGIAAELRGAGVAVQGAKLTVSGTVPAGAGLSSSAALEVSLALALVQIARAPTPEPMRLARICSAVENDWVGARTGLLDQLASLCGELGHALLIDFSELTVRPVALALGEFRLVTLDSGERHVNTASGYNERREECARACELLGVRSLSEVTAEQADSLPQPLMGRARHVLSENRRVRETVAALGRGDLAAVGELLNASHASLRDDFQVSTPAVETAVARLREAGAIGARILGGGFGGHVLGLLAPGSRAPAGA